MLLRPRMEHDLNPRPEPRRLAVVGRCLGVFLAPGGVDGCPVAELHERRGSERRPAGLLLRLKVLPYTRVGN